ncbi:methyltransferase domain-containing protein [Candidatus Roizmanbacteria bacterium]|nr:methyltransferase domain-containing protein [Candidatus Roizmanbacteria bacterium]
MSVYTLSLIYSSIKGSPYVATRKKRVEEILKDANLKKGEIFYELGSGDGRISRLAAKKYGVRSVGIDVNPILVFWSNFLTKMHGLDDCKFIKMNIFDFDFSKADYLYIFLMPVLIDKLIPKLKKELKKGTLIISHGFKVKDKKIKLVKTTEAKMFNTYYYRI